MSFPTNTGDGVPGMPMREAQVCLGPAFAQAAYNFFVSGSSFATPANVYQDAGLTTPFPNTGIVNADSFGRFPPIYLDGSIIYAVQLFGTAGNTVYSIDPYTSPLSTRGLSTNVSYGPQIAATGEIILAAPAAGGSQITLKLAASVPGQSPLLVNSTLPGQSAIIINNSVTTGAQTATFAATNKPGTATSSPAGWLPITCDGVQYYTPIWHGNNFTPYVSNPTAVGEVIVAQYVNFGGNGATTATGGTATPSSWFTPNANNIGGGYYITITKTGGNSGTSFSAAANTNITNGGLTIGTVGSVNTVLTGTYTLSTSVSGTPIVASGTIQLSGNATGTGAVDQQAISGAASLVLAGNGTSTLNSVAGNNWYTPTTASIGTGYYINITRSGGTAGVNFNNAQGAWTNISAGGITIGLTGGGQRNATGTYQISSNAGGTAIVASGSISLTAAGVNNTNYSGSAALAYNSDGSASLNNVAAGNWFSPTTAGIGPSYWVDITRTSGTSGVNFSAAQGSWTNIGSSGLIINLTGTSGVVGTATVGGTYQISNSATGSPVLGSGTISLSVTGLQVIHIYTTVTTNATETILSGTTTVTIAVWGSGGGGGNGFGSGCSAAPGIAGGCGGRATSSYAASALGGVGRTFKYTVGVPGSGNAVNGAACSVAAGTVSGFTAMSGNGGTAATTNTGGGGGTATGGNVSNTTGTSNSTVGLGTSFTGDGAPHGGGGAAGAFGTGHIGGAGTVGAVVFRYT